MKAHLDAVVVLVAGADEQIPGPNSVVRHGRSASDIDSCTMSPTRIGTDVTRLSSHDTSLVRFALGSPATTPT
jgi:hypothetical protein